MMWDDIYHDPEVPFYPDQPEPMRLRAALAAQLMGWANCLTGHKPPKGFGVGMIKLGKITGVTLLDDIRAEAAKLKGIP